MIDCVCPSQSAFFARLIAKIGRIVANLSRRSLPMRYHGGSDGSSRVAALQGGRDGMRRGTDRAGTMTITTTLCPHCKVVLNIPEEGIGRRLKCPQCAG